MATNNVSGTILAHARERGESDGKAAATWVEISEPETAVAWLEDERQLDDLPSPNLSGEWADDITGPQLFAEILDAAGCEPLDGDDECAEWFTETLDAYSDAYRRAAEEHVMARAREVLAAAVEVVDFPHGDVIDTRDLLEVLEDEDRTYSDEVLRALEEVESYCPDFRYGEALIRESHFTEYAQQLAEDIGAVDSNATWPMRCIDWKQAADELREDYTETEIDGTTYLYR